MEHSKGLQIKPWARDNNVPPYKAFFKKKKKQCIGDYHSFLSLVKGWFVNQENVFY